MTPSTDYGGLQRSKIKQWAAKDALLTEKRQLQDALQHSGVEPFGRKVKPVGVVHVARSFWHMTPQMFGMATLAVVFMGLYLRQFEYFMAGEGLGYGLGIIGGCAMLALLFYPLRKRVQIFTKLGDMRIWFRIHMVLGVLGPVLILFHANFGLGSSISTAAIFAMLSASLSGVIGRYLYGKIHHGLYGQKIEPDELKDELDKNQQEVAALLHLSPALKSEVFKFTDQILAPTSGLFRSWTRILNVGIRSYFLTRKVGKSVQQELHQNTEMANDSRREIQTRVHLIVSETGYFLSQVGNYTKFIFYQRLFALWHMLHLALCSLFIMAATVHVVMVHWS